ncbi:TonB-dependent receptor [Phenylobacterium sp.]|uniref:TonB-dependent receptor n=1 Tax=Phenylobacterium sp. TaxID=1871053 RepID=UPI0039836C33
MTRPVLAPCLAAFALLSPPLQARAAEADDPVVTAANEVSGVTVPGSRTSRLGVAQTANEGVVTLQQLEARTVYRPGELLEVTPGLIVSQHSGEGKANQFYLRGFNLDHGTDLRTTVDGMIVNQRSHGHGQGWTDVNFLIPELTAGLDYRKGPYSAEEGDFASAGAVSVRYVDTVPAGLLSLGLGENGYRRALVVDSFQAGRGDLLYALELFHNDGPFTRGDDYAKANGVLRYSADLAGGRFNVTLMGYDASWNATDQIPLRAVAAGALDRFSSIDPTDGGEAHRYSLSGAWRRDTEAGSFSMNAYLIDWRLDLYSNFTYFLDDPVNGDQFSQPDHRVTSGLNAKYAWRRELFARPWETTFGVQVQNDNIFNALNNTRARQVLSTTRRDHIVETSGAVFVSNATRWTDSFRTVAGLRADHYRFKVRSDFAPNSGERDDSILSPSLGLIFGPWSRTEAYLNAGAGFHSNDARGTTIAVDPKSGDPADPVPPLVRSKGLEAGVRSEFIPRLQTTLSVYGLEFDSELTFAGDAGTTNAGRASRRVGFELSNYYKPTNWLTLDADIAFARARFRGSHPGGDRIPGAVEGVASAAASVDNLGPWFGALQLRYFGPRPLIEDNSVRSESTATLNGRVGYRINPRLRVELEGFNLTDEDASAIDYFYTSRLPGEPAEGVDDIHFHPIESRAFRLSLQATF